MRYVISLPDCEPFRVVPVSLPNRRNIGGSNDDG